MQKEISLNTTLYDLCSAHPQIVVILKELGFVNITKPGMIQSAGRIMTIPKGCRMMKVPIERVTSALSEHGFIIKEEEII
ncbi:MAG: DUF1858 domain-containing protein [Bacillaceae bacterium]|nr:DUF1858 domain-containing protein [Bacillaceae bacterium]